MIGIVHNSGGGGTPAPTPTVVKLGTLYVNGVKQKRPLYPYAGTPPGAPAPGDIPAYTSGSIEIRDSDIDEAYRMQWVQVNFLGKTMFIADRACLSTITWDTLNSQGLIFGKNITIAGNTYKLRVLTGGSSIRVGTDGLSGGQPVDNEWDSIICNETNLSGLPVPNSTDLDSIPEEADRTGVHNTLWSWYYMYSWCQETAALSSSDRAIRGRNSARTWVRAGADSPGNSRGWRPVLEPITAPPAPTTKAHVFGVEWNYALSSTALTRLTPSTDPNGLVTEDLSPTSAAEIVSPAIGSALGGSLFDLYMPWAGMQEARISRSDGIVRTRLSRTQLNQMISIPKYWYKIEKDLANSKMRFYVSDGPVEGVKVHEAFARGDGSGERDFIYVGKYVTNSRNEGSVTASEPLVGVTRAQARSDAKTASVNKNFWLWDYATWCAIWLLYLVEFADWDSQKMIGQGIVSASAVQNTGGTDNMVYHTGRAAGTDGQTQVQYRWIEGLWGNVRQWVDGINFTELQAYVCLDPTKFADNTTTNYTPTGITLSSSGAIKEIGYSELLPFSFIPVAVGGSGTTYIPDGVYTSASWRALGVGGYYNLGNGSGLYCFGADNAATGSYADCGSRLMFLP